MNARCTPQRALALTVLSLLIALPIGVQAQASLPTATPPAYVWSGQLVSLDQTAKSVAVRVPVKDHVARYLGQFKQGERILITWGTMERGKTDAVIFVGTYDTSHDVGGDFGYVLPAEFVSFDGPAKTLTLTLRLDPLTFAKFRTIQPERWVKVTSPFSQKKDTATIASVQTAEPPDRPSD